MRSVGTTLQFSSGSSNQGSKNVFQLTYTRDTVITPGTSMVAVPDDAVKSHCDDNTKPFDAGIELKPIPTPSRLSESETTQATP